MSFSPAYPLPPAEPHQDRKAGLVVFGIMNIVVGGICALFVLLMLAIVATAQERGGPPQQDPRTILPTFCVYGSLAVIFIWLGIGSMKARRWARALLLILSWSWLLTGLVMMVAMIFVLPAFMKTVMADAMAGQGETPQGTVAVAMVFLFLIVGVVMVVIPAVWVLFYRSRHVKATCEAEDPVERWTDHTPLPVLAICLWLASSVPFLLVMALGGHAAVPFFGVFVTGFAGALIYLLLVFLWVYGAWAMYHLLPRGWWIITLTLALLALSGALTWSRHDMGEMYRLMRYPAAQLAHLEKYSTLTGGIMKWLSLATIVPMLGYMVFLRKYFRPPPVAAAPADEIH